MGYVAVMTSQIGRPGTEGLRGPTIDPSPSELLALAAHNFQHMGGTVGAQMDALGVDREGIVGTRNGNIRVPHRGTGSPEQLATLQRGMQAYIDSVFAGSGIQVEVDGAPRGE